MKPRTFYIAKINIHGNIFSPNLNELIQVHIPRVILSSQTIKINSWNWSFTDVEEVEIDGNKLIVGNVTKSKHMMQKFKVGTRTEIRKLENETAKTSFFMYEPKSELLVYETTSDIKGHEFIRAFTELLSRDVYVGKVIIKPITIPYQIKKELLSMDKVTRISFHLIHPNPAREEFNLYQQIIDQHNLKQLKLEMHNEDGIKLKDEQADDHFTRTIENGISLVEKGYGDVEIAGYNEIVVQGKRKARIQKQNKRFSSAKSLLSTKIREVDPKRVLNQLFQFILSTKNK